MGIFHYFFILVIYCLALVFLTVYSYTQIDLNLTLSSNPIYQSVQKQLIYIGYYNRFLSTFIFVGCIIFLFALFFYLLRLSLQEKFSINQIIPFLIATVCILLFAYPAFSHDFFNYMFDARIVTYYHQNPYLHKANDFPNDLWIRFMHWTHRTYPYGPIWLVVTVPFSYLGFDKFVPTLFLYKLMFSLFYIGNMMFIYKIAQIINSKMKNYILLLYSVNPLVLIESLVSPHNESIMLFFLLWAIYLVLEKKLYKSFILLVLSALVKFVTLLLFPCFIVKLILKQKPPVFIITCVITLTIGVILEIVSKEAYPWYFIMPIAVASLLGTTRYISIAIFSFSFFVLLRYAPFLYEGSYTPTGVFIQNRLLAIPVIIVLSYLFIQYFFVRRVKGKKK